jgi:elongation factor G
MKAYHFEGDSGEQITEGNIPADILDRCKELREEMVEKVASTTDELMEKFFENGDLEIADIKKGLRKAICNNELYAVVCGSALQNI